MTAGVGVGKISEVIFNGVVISGMTVGIGSGADSDGREGVRSSSTLTAGDIVSFATDAN